MWMEIEENASINAASNNGMHPTANSAAFIENLAVAELNARRVMPGAAHHRRRG